MSSSNKQINIEEGAARESLVNNNNAELYRKQVLEAKKKLKKQIRYLIFLSFIFSAVLFTAFFFVVG